MSSEQCLISLKTKKRSVKEYIQLQLRRHGHTKTTAIFPGEEDEGLEKQSNRQNRASRSNKMSVLNTF